MSEDVARALAARETIMVDDKEVKLSPIDMRQLHEIQRAALSFYKRDYLSTIAQNLDLLGNGHGDVFLEKKLDEVARWDSSNLPMKMSYDVQNIKLNETLKQRLVSLYGELPDGDVAAKAVLSTALDAEQITSEEVKKLCGKQPRRVRIPYDMWWVTSSFDGMVTFVHASVQKEHKEITKEQVGHWPLTTVMEAARVVEAITAPVVGNM